MIRTLVMAVLMTLSVAACSNKQPDLKSPCTGAEGSPCDRRAVNQGTV